MIKLELNQTKFSDIINKMAIPIKSRKEPFLFPKIALTIHPDNEIEWIGRLQYVTVWVRVKYTTPSNISESAKILIDVPQFLMALKMLKSRGSIVTFMHYPDQDDVLTTEKQKRKEKRYVEYKLRKKSNSIVQGLLEELPFRLEKSTEIILFRNGLLRPNISGSCDVSFFKDSFKQVKLIQKERNKENKSDLLSLYNIYVDGNSHQIKIVAGNEHSINSKAVIYKNDIINGSGELHYTYGFAEIVNVLSGEIKFYAVDNGPLWIMQDTDQMKLRYLIAPTPIYRY
jgi:hypothetical protein